MKQGKAGIRLIGLTAVLALLLSAVTGCSASRHVSSVSAVSLFDGERLVLPLEGEAASGGNGENGYTAFQSEKTLEEMFSQIQAVPGIHAQKHETAILIQKTDKNHTDTYCLAQHEDSYVFSGMQGHVITDIDTDGVRTEITLLLPVHLISDPLIFEGETPYYTLYAGAAYETAGEAADFERFYQDSGWYGVSSEDGMLLLSAVPSGSGGPSDTESAGAGGLIVIQFREQGGSRFFTISAA